MALGNVILLLLVAGQLPGVERIATGSRTGESSPAIEPPSEMLSRQIDQAVAATSLPQLPQQRCSDHEFVRRVYLDLIGRSPNAAEINKFAGTPSQERRTELIASLLESEEFVSHFARVLDVMLMERRTGKRIAQAEWIAFLQKALREKWTFDRITQTIIAADGRGPNRAAAKFVLDRDVEPNALTRDIARVFLGRDLQCAQCHDHPNITDYYQSEYYQLQAFIKRSYLFEDPADKKKPYIGEKADGESEYQSVFTEDPAQRAVPGLLGDLTLEAEPRFDGEQAYVVEPSKTAAAQPKFSRRAELARILTSRNNDQFARNVANRLWAHMMGRGLVHPVDFDHGENPPANPQLLQILTEGLRRHQFRIREFLGEIARSNVYQSSIDIPNQTPNDEAQLTSLAAQAEQQIAEAEQRREMTKEFLNPFELKLSERRSELASLDQSITEYSKQREASQKAVAELEKKAVELKKDLEGKEKKLAESSKAVKSDDDSKDSPAAKVVEDDKAAVAASKKAVDDNAAAVAAEKKKSSELLRQIGTLKSRRVGVADAVAEARGALGAARKLKSTESPISHFKQQLTFLKSAKQLVHHQHGLTRIAQEMASIQRSLKKGIEEQNQRKATLAKAQQSEAAQQKMLAQQENAAEAKRKQFASRQETLAELAEVLQRGEELASTLADDPLMELVASTTKRRATLQSELTQFQSQIARLEQETDQAKQSLEQAKVARLEAEKGWQSASDRVEKWESQLAKLAEQKRSTEVELSVAREKWIAMQERRLVMRKLKPLSPEQLAGATISALGLDETYRKSAESDWKKKNKDVERKLDDPKQQVEVKGHYDKRIGQVRDTFVSLFAAPAGAPQDVFSSTADQALFLANDGRVQSWLSPGEGTLVKKLAEMNSSEHLAHEMYLNILCRPPTAEEASLAGTYLTSRDKDKTKAIQEMVWGLLSSVEFRFNH